MAWDAGCVGRGYWGVLSYERGRRIDLRSGYLSERYARCAAACAARGIDLWWIKNDADVLAVEHGCYVDEEAGWEKADWIECACVHVEGALQGQPLLLAPWFLYEVILPLFSWKRPDGLRRFRKAYIEVPRKNNKSTGCAALALLLTGGDGEPGAQVVAASGGEEQAKIVWGIASNMVKQSARLSEQFEPLSTGVFHAASASLFKAVTSKGTTKHGFNIHGLVKDELHVWADRELYAALTTAGGSRRQPLDISITTAGFDRQSICWEEREYALRARDGSARDDEVFCYIAAAEPEDPWWKLETMIRANPGLELDEWIEPGEPGMETGANPVQLRRTCPAWEVLEGQGRNGSCEDKCVPKSEFGNEGAESVPKSEFGNEGSESVPKSEFGNEGSECVPKSEFGNEGSESVPKSEFGNEGADAQAVPVVTEWAPDYLERLQKWVRMHPVKTGSVRLDTLIGYAVKAAASAVAQNDYRRLCMNQWTSQQERWLDMEVWRRCAGAAPLNTLKGRWCWLAIDYAARNDLAAAVFLFPPEDFVAWWMRQRVPRRKKRLKRLERKRSWNEIIEEVQEEMTRYPDPAQVAGEWLIRPMFWIPREGLEERARLDGAPFLDWVDEGWLKTCAGHTNDHAQMVKEIMAFKAKAECEVAAVGWDPWNIGGISAAFSEHGITGVEYGQTFDKMHTPLNEVMSVALAGKFRHGGHPVLAWNVENVVVEQDSQNRWRPSKRKSKQKIDGVSALTTAMGLALKGEGIVGKARY